MHEQTPAANLVADRCHAEKHIPQQRGSEALSFVILVYAESCEQRDRLRIATCAFDQSLWRSSGVDLGHSPRVIRNHCMAISRGNNEYLRCTRCHRLASIAAQPLGLFDRPADELVEIVMAIKGFRGPVTHSTNGEGRSINLRTPGSSRAGRALIVSHSVSALADSTNRSRSASIRSAAAVRLASANSVRVLPDSFTARSISSRAAGVVRSSIRSLRVRVVIAPVVSRNVRPVYGHKVGDVNALRCGASTILGLRSVALQRLFAKEGQETFSRQVASQTEKSSIFQLVT